LRRIKDLAVVGILSAFVAACVGILVVFLLGKDGVLWFVVTAPAVNFMVASYYTALLPRHQTPHDLVAIKQQWVALLKLGVPIMAAGLITLVTQLAVRSIVLRQLGLEASGYFQAAWAISFTYVGFVLNAMIMDYFPRLTVAIGDHKRARTLVNEQVEMALLIAGPVLMAIVTLAPWVIQLLYSQGFSPAAEILKWQALGDIFKVASVPIVYVFLAAGHGGISVGIQLLWSAAYLGLLVLGIGEFGLAMTGVGFGGAYLIYFVVVTLVANRLIKFKLTQRNWRLTLVLSVSAGGIMFVAGQSDAAGYVVGTLATFVMSVYCLRRLDHLVDVTGWLRQKFS
jgi:PST family polysaccharide transporter